MENKRNFDRMAYLKQTVNQFINKETVDSVERQYNLQLSHLNKDLNNTNQIKKKILKDCKDIFTLSYVRAAVADAKEKGMPYSELVSIVTKRLASRVFSDDKRHYNMSAITSKGMISNVPTFHPIDGLFIGPEDSLYDLEGNPMSIKHIGTLEYETLASDEYIFKFRVCRQINGVDTEPQEVFSNIDLNRILEEKEYYYAVVGELLSNNNIDLSFADSYVGEISGTDGSPLKIEQEYFDKDPQKDKVYGYTYRISKNFALVYDGEKIEAIRAYNKEQAKKKAIEQEEPEH